MFTDTLVVVKGAGDLATGVAVRLSRAGFSLVMTELAAPLAVRRTVALAEAIYAGQICVEGVCGERRTLDELVSQRRSSAPAAAIPVLIDPAASVVARLRPAVVIDAIMAKRNTGTTLDDAPLVIGLGPGFHAGVDCHVVVETNRGHNLGRVLWHGCAEADTGLPGPVTGVGFIASRVLRAPVDGALLDALPIGAQVAAHQQIARITGADGAVHLLTAPFAGILRGMIHPSVPLQQGMKIGDLDPRIQPEQCFTVSDKSLAIGGGVLEAVLTMAHQRGWAG